MTYRIKLSVFENEKFYVLTMEGSHKLFYGQRKRHSERDKPSGAIT